MVLTASFGSYPRPDSLREYQIKAYGKQKKIDHIPTKDDERMLLEATKQVVEDQTSLGIITDGMLTWDDYLASVTAGWSGIKMGGLIRFYDNNTYYRRPTIIGPVENKKPSLKGSLELLKGLNPGSKAKAIVPGPYTLYDLSEDKFYNDPEAAIKAYSKAIEAEVKELKADFIQIDEPSISYNLDRKLFPLVKDELKKIARAAKGKTIITTYFGDLTLCMREVIELQDTKADYIGVDCVSFKNNYETVVRSGLKNLQLGLLDARNTKADNEILIRDRIEMIGGDKLIISTNCGLEFLPRKYALRKLELLSMLSNE